MKKSSKSSKMESVPESIPDPVSPLKQEQTNPKPEKQIPVKEFKNQDQSNKESKNLETSAKMKVQKKPKKKQRVKGNWKKEEDIMLMKLVRENGARNWSKIAENFPNRIGKQCRERWHNHLNPKINKKKWTEQEEAILLVTHERFGNRWALISKYLPGRTDNCIKNHWNSTMRRKLRNNFFKNYPLEELKGHLFDGQENAIEAEIQGKRGRKKRKQEKRLGEKRDWREAELSKQAQNLDFISSLKSNSLKMPFQREALAEEESAENRGLSLQSLLTLLPSPFLSDSLTHLNSLTSSLQSLLSVLLTKNPMKTPLSPLVLLKQILHFLELNVSSQIQDHFPNQSLLNIKRNLICSIKKNHHLERKKFDESMKIALDKKIKMMEQEKDRNYQLARLIETIKTKNSDSQEFSDQKDNLPKIYQNKQHLIHPISKKYTPNNNTLLQKKNSFSEFKQNHQFHSVSNISDLSLIHI